MQHDLVPNAIAWEQRGILAQDRGHHAEAASHFRQALALSDRALSWLGLALSQIELKHDDDAVCSLRRARSLAPQSGVVGHLLAALTGQAPLRAPDSFVKWLFNSRAGSFDTHLTRLGYRGPQMLHDLIALHWTPEAMLDILDLGCGTGLSGIPFRPYAARLDGVDLTPNMLVQASRRGIYDNLECNELHADLRNRPANGYDAVLAADTLIYVGDLQDLFALVARALKPGGSFLFTVETGTEGSAYTLTSAGRYSHADDYLRDCAADLFEVGNNADGMIRVENGSFAEGRAYRFVKRGLSAPSVRGEAVPY
ncbi:MAG TPA: methyltransferase domain-containing protein [Ferrovibrio sp.]|jgi:predicted TPR repeat methyltransferase|uniref:class I SAM-dependent DNA methyltransferase n=1 Tax=Ferrovibrio sp. TaxID=1917215 RepID=UPI002ED25FEC